MPLILVLLTLMSASGTSLASDRTFGGYDCTSDCSGHAAGYRWAEQNGIQNAYRCRGNSNSFIEGCKVFTQDPYRGADEDDDGDEIEE